MTKECRERFGLVVRSKRKKRKNKRREERKRVLETQSSGTN